MIELTSTCTQQKEQLSKLATDESGSEVTIDFLVFFFSFRSKFKSKFVYHNGYFFSGAQEGKSGS